MSEIGGIAIPVEPVVIQIDEKNVLTPDPEKPDRHEFEFKVGFEGEFNSPLVLVLLPPMSAEQKQMVDQIEELLGKPGTKDIAAMLKELISKVVPPSGEVH